MTTYTINRTSSKTIVRPLQIPAVNVGTS